MADSATLAVIAKARVAERGGNRVMRDNWLRTVYSRYVNGGWTTPDGTRVDKPSRVLMRIHTACKALYCPACKHCKKPARACRCKGGHKTCWTFIGFAPKDEDTSYDCPNCKLTIPWREALYNNSVWALCGNQSGKTIGTQSEFVAWLRGRRDWDDTLTCRPGEGALWGISCRSIGNDARSTICPEFERRAHDLIKKVVYNSNGAISHYEMHDSRCVKVLSYEQWRNAGKDGINPYEGMRFYCKLWDEPPPGQARSAALRGLVHALSQGGGAGREIGAATPMRSHYLLHQVQGKAWNLGGPTKGLFVVTGTIHDNPSLTTSAKDYIMSQWLPEEREAREKGMFLHHVGRVFQTFDETIHTYQPSGFDPLVDEKGEPTDIPIAMAVDPHSRRPWAMLWVAIAEDGTWYFVREWPTEWFHEIRSCKHDYDAYAKVIEEVEATIPGGSKRVMWREMDPNSGRTPGMGAGYDSISDAMRQRGLFFRTDTCDAITQGHMNVRQRLSYDTKQELSAINRPACMISTACKNLIWSLHNYVFDEWRDDTRSPREKPKEVGKDFIDLWRYLEGRNPRHRSWKGRDAVAAARRQKIVSGLKAQTLIR